jgi:hypothetical protein
MGRAVKNRFHAPLFVILGGTIIDLEDHGFLQESGEVKGPRIESGTQNPTASPRR